MNRPSGLDSASNGVAGNTRFSAPLAESLGSSGMGNMGITTPIVQLNVRRSPSAVFWRVIPIIVDAIKGMAIGWSKAHVSKEIIETTLPSVAYRYASSAVAFVGRVLIVFASRSHVRPRDVFTRLGLSVSSRMAHEGFYSVASAGGCFSVPQIRTSGLRAAAAIASADPVEPLLRFGMIGMAWFGDRQIAKSGADSDLRSMSSHLGDITLLGAF